MFYNYNPADKENRATMIWQAVLFSAIAWTAFEAPISFDIAVLGGTINVPGLESKIALKIPSYTQTGKIFRIKGKGAASVRDSRRGDLLCRVIVETPVNLSKAQLKKLEDFSQSIASSEHYPIKESFVKVTNQFLNK